MTAIHSDDTLLEKVHLLKALLVERATSGSGAGNDEQYKELRREFLANSHIRARLPPFVAKCRDLTEFWDFISGEVASGGGAWARRREFLREAFDPLLSSVEFGQTIPADALVSAALSSVDSAHVRDAWQKALDRRHIDPEGAITAARTLIEATCKYILDETSIAYDNNEDLPKLYFKAAEQLNLAPSQHTEQAFRQILGGCQTVVNELAGLRNRLSDAHGKGKLAVKPSARHAELAVNLAGAMATFLVATWETRMNKDD